MYSTDSSCSLDVLGSNSAVYGKQPVPVCINGVIVWTGLQGLQCSTLVLIHVHPLDQVSHDGRAVGYGVQDDGQSKLCLPTEVADAVGSQAVVSSIGQGRPGRPAGITDLPIQNKRRHNIEPVHVTWVIP